MREANGMQRSGAVPGGQFWGIVKLKQNFRVYFEGGGRTTLPTTGRPKRGGADGIVHGSRAAKGGADHPAFGL